MFFIDSGVKLYYETVGEGIPIIIIHGCSCDHRLMKGCLEPYFKKNMNYKRVYIDLPGMGKSFACIEMATSDKILECLSNFIESNIEGDFLLIGESYGAYIVQGLMNQFAYRIKGSALICPVVITEREKRSLPIYFRYRYDEIFLKRLNDNEKKEFCEFAVIADEQTYKRYIEEIKVGIEIADMKFIRALEKNYAFSEIGCKVSCFDKPVLIILGKQDNCVGYKDALSLLDIYPRSTLSIIDMAGHNLQIERPYIFNALLEEWLERVQLE